MQVHAKNLLLVANALAMGTAGTVEASAWSSRRATRAVLVRTGTQRRRANGPKTDLKMLMLDACFGP
jgi:hypothetical protein